MNRVSIGSDNGLSPGRRQTIIWTNDGILLIGPQGTNFSESLMETDTFSFKKMEMSSGKWRPFCLGLNVLRKIIPCVPWGRIQNFLKEIHQWTLNILHLFVMITVTSQWARWRLNSPASRLFTQPFIQVQIKENIKDPRHWLLWGEFTGDRWIPRTKANYAEDVSIWWRHHDVCGNLSNFTRLVGILVEHIPDLGLNNLYMWSGAILWVGIYKCDKIGGSVQN